MKSAVKTLLALALVLTAASGAWAQAAGDWHKIHGQVQSIQGNQLTLKADDGRIMQVDVSQVSTSVRGAMTPGLGVTVTGFPVTSANNFTARYIEQDNAGSASVATGDASGAVARVLPLVGQFVSSSEFQNKAAGLKGNRQAAHRFASQLYRGFLEREPSQQERDFWANQLLQSGDVQATVETFMKSPEYAGQNKTDTQMITDLYQGLFGRTPTAEELRNWQQQIARR